VVFAFLIPTCPRWTSDFDTNAHHRRLFTQLGHLRRGFHGGSTDFPGVLADFGVISAEM
jgi:hypothetical protein